METDAIYLCARTALRVWQLLRALWEPRLDQLAPLTHRFDELHIKPAQLEELVPCRLDASQIDVAVRTCLERACRNVRRASRQAETLRGVPLSDPLFMRAASLVLPGQPIDLLVGSTSHRSHRRKIHYHVHAGALPADMFVRLGQGVYLETPLHALSRVAPTFSTDELIMLAFELRGAYQTGLFGPVETARCLPLFDGDDLRAFLREHRGSYVYGSNVIKPLLIVTVDRAGSSMEAASIVLLCLPIAKGGYGLAWPTMNWRIDVPEALRGLSGWDWVACDAFWPEARVAFEYDGSVHQGERSQRDILRANVLTMLDIPTVTITKNEFFNVDAFDRAARQLARKLHHRLDARRLGPAWLATRNELHGRIAGVLSDGFRAGEHARAELQRLAVDNAADAFGETDLWIEG